MVHCWTTLVSLLRENHPVDSAKAVWPVARSVAPRLPESALGNTVDVPGHPGEDS